MKMLFVEQNHSLNMHGVNNGFFLTVWIKILSGNESVLLHIAMVIAITQDMSPQCSPSNNFVKPPFITLSAMSMPAGALFFA
jgi:hypothetical protein